MMVRSFVYSFSSLPSPPKCTERPKFWGKPRNLRNSHITHAMAVDIYLTLPEREPEHVEAFPGVEFFEA